MSLLTANSYMFNQPNSKLITTKTNWLLAADNWESIDSQLYVPLS